MPAWILKSFTNTLAQAPSSSPAAPVPPAAPAEAAAAAATSPLSLLPPALPRPSLRHLPPPPPPPPARPPPLRSKPTQSHRPQPRRAPQLPLLSLSLQPAATLSARLSTFTCERVPKFLVLMLRALSAVSVVREAPEMYNTLALVQAKCWKWCDRNAAGKLVNDETAILREGLAFRILFALLRLISHSYQQLPCFSIQ